MPMNQKEIITVFNLNQKTHSRLETIVLEYGSLAQRMNNLEQQSWMFKKAQKNNLEKINRLRSEFKKIRTDVNTTSIDGLIESLNDYNEQAIGIQRGFQRGLIKVLALASFNSKTTYIEEILRIKSRVDKMNELDDYLQNKESLIKLLGW